MQSGSFKRLLVSLALVSFAQADYYVDDQNYTSLLYSENPGGAVWGPFHKGGDSLLISLTNGTMMTIDASQCFNYTYTYAACTAADDCQVQIPFTGSGITIYVLQAGAEGINASLTIDGGAPKYNLLPAPPGPNFYIPNVTLFSVQGISTGNHTATMTVLSWDNIFSGMMFDYALINQTVVSPTTTSLASSTAASTMSIPTATTPLPSSNSGVNIGAVGGGIIGGIAALGALLLAVFYLRRRHRRHSVDLDTEPKMEPFLPERPYHTGPEQYSDVPHPQTTESPVTLPSSTQPPHSASSPSLSQKSRMGSTNPSASQIANANAASHTQAGTSSALEYTPGSSDASRPRIQQDHPMLSNDQADFVNNLYANNVPAAAIARVIERMIAGERQPVVDGFDTLPPPSYYHGSSDA